MKNKMISLALMCALFTFSISYQTPAIVEKNLNVGVKTIQEEGRMRTQESFTETTTTEETTESPSSGDGENTTQAPSSEETASTKPTKTSLVSLTNLSGKKLRVVWNVNTSGTGYQVQIATNKKFSGKFTHNIYKNTVKGIVFTNLKKKKTYYVRVRTISKVGDKTYYSKWSSKKHKKIKK